MSAPKRAFLSLITLYQWLISPLLGGNCRFYPTCSEYGKEAIGKHGILHGGWLTVKRMARCRPGAAPGVDPVP